MTFPEHITQDSEKAREMRAAHAVAKSEGRLDIEIGNLLHYGKNAEEIKSRVDAVKARMESARRQA